MALITFSSPLHKDKTVYAVAGSHTQTILDLAKEHHIPIDFGCQEGNCGTCLVKVSSVDGKRAPMGGPLNVREVAALSELGLASAEGKRLTPDRVALEAFLPSLAPMIEG